MNKGRQKTTTSEARPITEFYSLSYSPSQGAFHIETLAELLNRNLAFLAEHRQYPDYLLIGVYSSYDEADSWCRYYQHVLPEVIDPVETAIMEIEGMFKGADDNK